MSSRSAVPGSSGRPAKGAAQGSTRQSPCRSCKRASAEIAPGASTGAVGGQGQDLSTVIGLAERGSRVERYREAFPASPSAPSTS